MDFSPFVFGFRFDIDFAGSLFEVSEQGRAKSSFHWRVIGSIPPAIELLAQPGQVPLMARKWGTGKEQPESLASVWNIPDEVVNHLRVA